MHHIRVTTSETGAGKLKMYMYLFSAFVYAFRFPPFVLVFVPHHLYFFHFHVVRIFVANNALTYQYGITLLG